jgi:hypothetical protein
MRSPSQPGSSSTSFWWKKESPGLPGTIKIRSQVAAGTETSFESQSAVLRSSVAAGASAPWQRAVVQDGTMICE